MDADFKKLVLCLELLRGEEHPLGPDHAVAVPHRLELLPVRAENGRDLLSKRVLETLHGREVEHFGETGAPCEPAGDGDQTIGGTHGGKWRGERERGRSPVSGDLADLDFIA